MTNLEAVEHGPLDRWSKPVRAIAQVRKAVVDAHRARSFEYGHGMTYEEIERECKARHIVLTRYKNRVRDNFYDGFFGRHYVHGKQHYYPLCLDDEDQISHENCANCEKGGNKQ